MMNVRWGNSLENLADMLFQALGSQGADSPADVLSRRECVVVPNRLQQVWLQQRFLYELPRKTNPHVLANFDFPLLNVFVNDWLFRMGDPRHAGKRDPDAHPFATKSMRWRIHAMLQSGRLFEDPDFSAPARYVKTRDGKTTDPRRCFKLAGRLAKLMDEYMVYRPEMLSGWENGDNKPAAGSTLWEPALWRALTAGTWKDKSYLAAFRRMDRDLRKAGVANEYNRISIFAPSMMPRVYLVFFHILGETLPVDLYLFNPSNTDWFDNESLRKAIKAGAVRACEAQDDSGVSFNPGHPLLGVWARGCRDLVAETIDLTSGESGDGECFAGERDACVLEALQTRIAANDDTDAPVERSSDGSIQLNLCHGPMREVEVLRDQLLHCFATMDGLQPRHIQVQVADMNTYAPYIEAVFSTQNKNAPGTIPFVLADRVVSGESAVAGAFRQLLELSDSRFTAPEVLGLLRCDSVAAAFHFDSAGVDSATEWLRQAGVRWGRDRVHRHAQTAVDFTEQTTWRHGLDRLLLGYAMGRETEPGAVGGNLPPCDCVEGDDAVLLGRLGRFFEELTELAEYCAVEHTPDEWAGKIEYVVDTFFVSNNETYMEVDVLKRALRAFRTSVKAAEYEGLTPVAVIRDFLIGQLDEAAGGSDTGGNAVVFCALRPGSSVPRRVMCVMGMGDGVFPRMENRPAYDLLRGARKMGDRSASIDDRMAWLEAIMNAREKLVITYTAFSPEDNERICESVVVRELTEYLARTFGRQSFGRVQHRLQAFHPEYFRGSSDMFSYSESNCRAAAKLLEPRLAIQESPPALSGAGKLKDVSLEELVSFFRNPAKFHCTKVLGVRLEPDTATALADSEVFDPDGLEEYKIREYIVDAMIQGAGDETLLREHLTAGGLLPLADWGKRWFHGAWVGVEELLAVELAGLGPLNSVLKARHAAGQQERHVDLTVGSDCIRVTGTVPVFKNAAGAPAVLTFRAGTTKAATRLEDWLTHLFVCACGIEAVSCVVQGRTADKLEILLSQAADPDAAKQMLAVYVDIYRKGLSQVPAYTPETALAYVEKLADNKKAGDESSRREAAVAASMKKWTSGAGHPAHDGDQNAYFRYFFGPDGPFKNVEFADIAVSVMKPMFDNQSKPEPAGGA